MTNFWAIPPKVPRVTTTKKYLVIGYIFLYILHYCIVLKNEYGVDQHCINSHNIYATYMQQANMAWTTRARVLDCNVGIHPTASLCKTENEQGSVSEATG